MTEKLKMKTADMASENFEKLKALFPNCVTESLDKDGNPVRAIDKDLLMQEINSEVVEGQKERYQFNWPGKRDAIRKANAPTTMTLRPCKDESVDFDNTQNLYIEGDNLEVLKLLQNNYLGKVKMIYIDPPYNTGNDFVYNDNFKQDSETFLETSGMFDEDGNMTLQNFEKNSESNGRFHTDWLNMMYPRLKVARNLLSDDGVIFISIDDNEVQNLKKICDEIFGDHNFVSNIVWQSTAGSNTGTDIVTVTENALVYTKNRSSFCFDGMLSDEDAFTLTDEYESERGKFSLDKLDRRRVGSHYSEALNFPITMPDGTIRYPGGSTTKSSEGWNYLWSKNKVQWGLEKGFIVFKKNDSGDWAVYNKRYAKIDNEGKPIERSIPFRNLITSNQCNTAQGTKEIRDLFESRPFDFPKPTSFLKQLLLTSVRSSKESLILDFFSGSATTAHAVMQLNAEDGGNRKYICIQLPESTSEDSEAYKAGYKNICEIGKERIRRAGDQILELSLQNLEKEGIVEKYARELPEIRSLEEVYGPSGIGLCLGEEVAEGGNIRSVGSNSQGCGVDSVEHSGGAISGEQGVCPVFENSKGITSGTGNTIVDLRTLKILNENGCRIKLEALGRNQQNDLFADKAFDIKGLSSKLSVLNSDRGFRVLKIDDSNMKDVYYSAGEISQQDLVEQISNIKDGRTDMDLLFGCLVDWGVPLSLPIKTETIENLQVYNVNDGDLVACFANNIPEAAIRQIAATKPLRAVFRDSSFKSDSAKINVTEIFKTISPSTTVKVV